MKILCFGLAREIIGSSTKMLTDQKLSTVGALKEYLIKSYPEFEQYKQFRIAVNQSFATNSSSIEDHDEVAIIPPVSGG